MCGEVLEVIGNVVFFLQCEKIRKRRSSIFGTFHLANSSALEEAGLQITKAVYVFMLC